MACLLRAADGLHELMGWLQEHFFHRSNFKLDLGGTCAACVLRGLGYGLYVGMFLQHLTKGFAQDAHAAAVDHADAW